MWSRKCRCCSSERPATITSIWIGTTSFDRVYIRPGIEIVLVYYGAATEAFWAKHQVHCFQQC